MGAPAISPAVAITETWTPSRRMQAAAAAERERVDRELARLTAREHELASELAQVRAAREDLLHQQHVLNHFAHASELPRTPGTVIPLLRAVTAQAASAATAAPASMATVSDGAMVLRGARIRETAVRVLVANHHPEAPVHYRDWFELVTAQGFMPAGKDPLATFLTQIGRSPVVKRTTSAGKYVLDLEFPARARARLAHLTAELAATHDNAADVTVAEIAEVRERRARLTTELQEMERRLEEALRALGDMSE